MKKNERERERSEKRNEKRGQSGALSSLCVQGTEKGRTTRIYCVKRRKEKKRGEEGEGDFLKEEEEAR